MSSGEFVDRGTPLAGINQTIRDSRVPFNQARSIVNFNLPDGRARRRKGKKPYSSQFHGSQLVKHTPFTIDNESQNSLGNSNQVAISPMSYALLKWHDDFQPRSDRDWTTEFLLTLGNPEQILYRTRVRQGKHDYGLGIQQPLRALEFGALPMGAVVFDMSVTANHFDCDYAGTSFSVDPTATNNESDSFALSALSVSYSHDVFKVGFDLFDTGTSEYRPGVIADFSFDYQAGRDVHVAMRYDSTTREFEVLLDGEAIGARTLAEDEVFAGEADAINELTYTVKRDIVLLNEYTVRGAMASTCKIVKEASGNLTDAFECLYQYSDTLISGATPYEPNLLCASPPSGTGITELRFWHSKRTDTELSDYARTRLSASQDGLKGYWKLDDGGPVCVETKFGSGEGASRLITIHHGSPGYVADSGLPGNFGLALADGQHLGKEYLSGELGLEDSYLEVSRIFEPGHEVSSVSKQYKSHHDFTVTMTIRTPHDFGKEQNYRASDTEQEDIWQLAGSAATDPESEDERYGMGYDGFGLIDGAPADSGRANQLDAFVMVGDGVSAARTWHRSNDQTLWSVEAKIEPGDETFGSYTRENDSLSDTTRVPLARGLLTPQGRVAFEFFGFDDAPVTATGGDGSREYRLVSKTSAILQPNTVYNLGFRKRTIAEYDSTAQTFLNIGFKLEVFIQGGTINLPPVGSEQANNSIAIGGVASGDEATIDIPSGGASAMTSSTRCSYAMRHNGVSDILIGSSYVRDSNDRSFRCLEFNTPTAAQFHQISQRYLSPWQDQPGYFVLGSFRMWSKGLSDGEIRSAFSGDVPKESLLFDIEIDKPGVDQVVSRANTNAVFRTGFKSWGSFRSYQEGTAVPEVSGTEVPTFRCGFALEDRLGWGALPDSFLNSREAACRGLTSFASTLERRFGILSVFDGAVYSDENLSGDFQPIYSTARGLLDDYTSNGVWRGASIGDRTVMASRSGRPRVWNGRELTTLGFSEWTGGNMYAQALDSYGSSTSLLSETWYGMRLVYVAEGQGIEYVGPQFSVKTTSGSQRYIRIWDISPHPDPRVTSIKLFITRGNDTSITGRGTANSSVLLYEYPNMRLENKFREYWDITGNVDDATNTLIDLSRTTFPACAHVASAFGRLYLAGDAIVPDIIYFSEKGNPESINKVTNNFVLEEGSGDEIVALRSAFGSLWAFKPGSIWQIRDTGQTIGDVPVHDQVKVTNIGPTSSEAITLVTFPESGRVAFVFWSRHGPYIFDGVNLQPIGYAVEGPDPFDDVEEGSVFIVHDIAHRELAFVYRSKSTCCGSSCDGATRDKAYVFNYRTGVWNQESGVIGSRGLSADLTIDVSSRADQTGTGIGAATLDTETRYFPLVGTDHGRIVLWGQGTYDGVDPSNYVLTADIDTWTESTLTMTVTQDETDFDDDEEFESEPWPVGEFRGLWVTVIRKDNSEWFMSPIEENGEDWIRLESRGCELPFTPEEGDRVSVALPPATIEFPWDEFGQPNYAKRLHQFVFWGKGGFYWRKAQDWDESTTDNWRLIQEPKSVNARGAGHRKYKYSTDGNSEAFKLYLASFEPGAEMDAYGWTLVANRDENKATL